MVEGSWHCDRNRDNVTVYVWTIGGVPPQNVLSAFASSGNALGVAWHQANARDARLVCHSRCYVSDYASNVFGTMSPDGLAVMFSSNMGVRGGRVDAYLALISAG